MTFSVRGVASTAFAAAVALLVGCSVLLYRATSRLSSSEALVAHTHEVNAVIEDLGSEVFHASNSAQAYILTGDFELLSGYRSALTLIPAGLQNLDRLTGDNRDRGPQLAALQVDIQNQLDLLAGFIQAHQKGVSNVDADAQMARQTADLQNRVENRLQQMRQSEDELLNDRQAASAANYRHTLRLIVVSFSVALLLIAAQMFLLNYSFTQYRRTENAAKQSREIVNAFFSSSTVGFGILDSNLRYTRVNDVLPRMAAVRPEDLLGKSVADTFGMGETHPEAVLREILRTSIPLIDREVSAELPSRPGEVRRWLVTYFPISSEAGRFTQIGIIAIDVTARRNAEEALRKLSGRLLGIQDQERRRIARELHDSLGQYLAGLKIALGMLSANPTASNREALLAECADILEKSITETRTLSHLLHPPLLDEAGFASAASWFVRGFSERSGIPVSLDLPPDMPRLSEAVEIAMFRILQESMTNVHRHSRATSAEIKVEADAEQISIEVSDCGCGMPKQVLQQIRSEGSKLGVGLAGMRERIHELGGTFDVDSDEKGTTIRATIPLSIREETQRARAGAEI